MPKREEAEMLGAVFTMADARAQGVGPSRLNAMIKAGELDRAVPGVYVRRGKVEPSVLPLAVATVLKPQSTVCLTSALVYHDLSDAVPTATDIALPRPERPPSTVEHVRWHSYTPEAFDVGRMPMKRHRNLDLWVFSPERTIVDMFRVHRWDGPDQAVDVLRRWLARPGSSRARLLRVAESFPRAHNLIGKTLEMLF